MATTLHRLLLDRGGDLPEDTWRFIVTRGTDAVRKDAAEHDDLPDTVAVELYAACTDAPVRSALLSRDRVPTDVVVASMQRERRVTVLREAAAIETVPAAALEVIADRRSDDAELTHLVATHPNCPGELTARMVDRLFDLYARTDLSANKEDALRDWLVELSPGRLLDAAPEREDPRGAVAALAEVADADWPDRHADQVGAIFDLIDRAWKGSVPYRHSGLITTLVEVYVRALADGQPIDDLPHGPRLRALVVAGTRTGHPARKLVHRHSRLYATAVAEITRLRADGSARALKQAWQLADDVLADDDLHEAISALFADSRLEIDAADVSPQVRRVVAAHDLAGADGELIVRRCAIYPPLLLRLARRRPADDPALLAAAEVLVRADDARLADAAADIRTAAGGWRKLPASSLVSSRSRNRTDASVDAAVAALAARPAEQLDTAAALLGEFTGTVGELLDTLDALHSADAVAAA